MSASIRRWMMFMFRNAFTVPTTPYVRTIAASVSRSTAKNVLPRSIEPKSASVFNNRGYSKFLAGDLPGAEADLKAAISLGPLPMAWVNLGKVQAKARRYGAAFKTFLNTLDTARAYNAVGEGAMSNGDHQIAKTYFENATNASPSYFEEAYKNLALADEALAGRDAGLGS